MNTKRIDDTRIRRNIIKEDKSTIAEDPFASRVASMAQQISMTANQIPITVPSLPNRVTPDMFADPPPEDEQRRSNIVRALYEYNNRNIPLNELRLYTPVITVDAFLTDTNNLLATQRVYECMRSDIPETIYCITDSANVDRKYCGALAVYSSNSGWEYQTAAEGQVIRISETNELFIRRRVNGYLLNWVRITEEEYATISDPY